METRSESASLKAIKTEDDYRVALAEVERLFDAKHDTPAADCPELLVALI